MGLAPSPNTHTHTQAALLRAPPFRARPFRANRFAQKTSIFVVPALFRNLSQDIFERLFFRTRASRFARSAKRAKRCGHLSNFFMGLSRDILGLGDFIYVFVPFAIGRWAEKKHEKIPPKTYLVVFSPPYSLLLWLDSVKHHLSRRCLSALNILIDFISNP